MDDRVAQVTEAEIRQRHRGERDQVDDREHPSGDRGSDRLLQAPPVDDNDLSPLEREVLAILAEGRTDEAVGRALGLSARTVQRLMADLSGRLGVHSRFQAGVEVVRRGWL